MVNTRNYLIKSCVETTINKKFRHFYLNLSIVVWLKGQAASIFLRPRLTLARMLKRRQVYKPSRLKFFTVLCDSHKVSLSPVKLFL